jgi:hypothetical protein
MTKPAKDRVKVKGKVKGKKAFKAFCYSQAKKGLWNTPDGSWTPLRTQDVDGMAAGYRAGYGLK